MNKSSFPRFTPSTNFFLLTTTSFRLTGVAPGFPGNMAAILPKL